LDCKRAGKKLRKIYPAKAPRRKEKMKKIVCLDADPPSPKGYGGTGFAEDADYLTLKHKDAKARNQKTGHGKQETVVLGRKR